jgi:hypothetical protein
MRCVSQVGHFRLPGMCSLKNLGCPWLKCRISSRTVTARASFIGCSSMYRRKAGRRVCGWWSWKRCVKGALPASHCATPTVDCCPSCFTDRRRTTVPDRIGRAALPPCLHHRGALTRISRHRRGTKPSWPHYSAKCGSGSPKSSRMPHGRNCGTSSVVWPAR